MKFKVGDEVIVTAGKDKGRRGKIAKVFPKDHKVLIPTINVYKKFQKRGANKTDQGGLVEFSRPLPVSNIAVICPSCGKPTRIGWQIVNDQKVRICKKCRHQL